MKRQATMVLTTLSLLVMLMATSVYAQSDMHLKVNIPFEFSVGKKILPAGEYTVRYSTQCLLVIQSVDRRASQIFITVPTQASTTPDKSSLVFNQYGDQYFLSAIWTAGADTGHELFRSRAEDHVGLARRALANSALARQTVCIVAHR